MPEVINKYAFGIMGLNVNYCRLETLCMERQGIWIFIIRRKIRHSLHFSEDFSVELCSVSLRVFSWKLVN